MNQRYCEHHVNKYVPGKEAAAVRARENQSPCSAGTRACHDGHTQCEGDREGDWLSEQGGISKTHHTAAEP